LINSLNSCDSSCSSIAEALGAIKDDAAVPALFNFVLENPQARESSAGMEAIMALGDVGTESAVEALKKIVADEGLEFRLRSNAFDVIHGRRGEKDRAFFCRMKDDPKLHDQIMYYYHCPDNSR